MKTYRDEGGIRVGTSHWASLGASWPSASLVVTPEKIELKYNALFDSDEFEFKRNEITGLFKKRSMLFFAGGLIIEHTNPGYPIYILFRTLQWKKLETALREMGWIIRRIDFWGNEVDR